MKNIIVVNLLISIFLVSCLSVQQVEPTSTPDPTPIPLSELNLEPILIQSGDLPTGYLGSQVKAVEDDAFSWITSKDVNNIWQDIAKGNKDGGMVIVFLFEQLTQVDLSYNEQVRGFGEPDNKIHIEEVNSVGEKATIFYGELPYFDKLVEVTFTRCNALVDIRLTDTDDKNDVLAYAKRLDARLTEVVCR